MAAISTISTNKISKRLLKKRVMNSKISQLKGLRETLIQEKNNQDILKGLELNIRRRCARIGN